MHTDYGVFVQGRDTLEIGEAPTGSCLDSAAIDDVESYVRIDVVTHEHCYHRDVFDSWSMLWTYVGVIEK